MRIVNNLCRKNTDSGSNQNIRNPVFVINHPADGCGCCCGVLNSAKRLPRPADIFRTFMTGLSGTPMPSFADSFTSAEDGWALTFFVLSLAADGKG